MSVMPLPDSGRNEPLIGLNMSWEPPGEAAAEALRVPVPYIEAVVRAGGVPLCLPIMDDPGLLRRSVSGLDAFLFIGGADYRPEHYGGRPQPERELVPERRDRFDFLLARHILEETDLPVLAICGGCQLLALVRGGGLIQDLRSDWQPLAGRPPLPHAADDRRGRAGGGGEPGPSDAAIGPETTGTAYLHPVALKPGSLIARVVGMPPGGRLETNSFHHQAVHPGCPGRGLEAAAWTDDGVVEAVEPARDSDWDRQGRFLLGLQWHAERMADRAEQQAVFRALTAAARRHRQERMPPRRGRRAVP
jgi:putative glutamine amidotransferase